VNRRGDHHPARFWFARRHGFSLLSQPGVALGTAPFAIDLLSHAASVNAIAPTLAILIRLGVGIDYALFIVTRYRHGLLAGMPTRRSRGARVEHGPAAQVLFAGGTVCIALLGLLVLRLHFFNGSGFRCRLAVVLTMATAITLLPALLGFMVPCAQSSRATPPRRETARRMATVTDSGRAWGASYPAALVILA